MEHMRQQLDSGEESFEKQRKELSERVRELNIRYDEMQI